ncbi:MAG: hypothetical protein KQJ78_17035 [Deltaproteobacteria bacterium]|nr:hypothetical protein [Deltaproteobacteria bacterium]
MRRAACLALAALWLALAGNPCPARAADDGFDKALAGAKRGYGQHRPGLTLESLRLAMELAWPRFPFQALNVHLTTELPAGFGVFTPRPDNHFQPGDPLFLYLEPVGFEVKKDEAHGLYLYDLAADFNLVDGRGNVVGGRRDFARFQGKSRYFPQRLPLNFTYSLKGLPPGDYTVETIIRDRLAHRSFTIKTPVVVERP